MNDMPDTALHSLELKEDSFYPRQVTGSCRSGVGDRKTGLPPTTHFSAYRDTHAY